MAKITLGKIIDHMWEHLDKLAVPYGLRPGELEKIVEFAPKVVLSIGTGALGYWNSLAKGGWATIGPRMLGPKFEGGTVTKIGKRTFLSPAPMGSKVQIVIEKLDGKAGAEILIRVHNRAGKVVEKKTISFPKDNTKPTKSFEVGSGKAGIVSVQIDAKMGALKADKFSYRIKYVERPIMNDLGPVPGIADLHVHQMAEYAFMGNWLHGSHAGPPAKALSRCSQSGHAIPDWIWNAMMSGPNASKVYHGQGFPGFNDWPHHLDMGHQQVHEQWLRQAHSRGLNLIVSCAVNNEPFSAIMALLHPREAEGEFRDMPVIKNQIREIQKFARGRSWCEVAANPWHARQIIHAGKMAIVISVECSNIFPADGGDYIDQLDELYQSGVRCIQIAHEVDSRFAGAAPQEKMLSVLQTVKRNTSLQRLSRLDIGFGFSKDSNGRNKLGLTKPGEKLVNAIMDRHMLLDTSHLSVKSFNDVFRIARKRHYYPLINSHTKFFDVLSDEEQEVQREFVTLREQVECYVQTGGILGLRTAPWVNRQAPRPKGMPDTVKTDSGPVGTAHSFAQQVTYGHDCRVPIALGTDINGFTNQLGPRSKHGRRSGVVRKPSNVSQEYWNHGLRHIGLLPDLVRDLSALRTPGADALSESAEMFLRSWERTWLRGKMK